MVGPLITETTLNFLLGSVEIHQLNLTDLVLIPKIKHVQTPVDFQPISFCNTIYEII